MSVFGEEADVHADNTCSTSISVLANSRQIIPCGVAAVAKGLPVTNITIITMIVPASRHPNVKLLYRSFIALLKIMSIHDSSVMLPVPIHS
jgi:hypothetical protein